MRTVLEHEVRPIRPSLLRRVLRSSAHLVTRIEDYFEYRRQLKELMTLDDRMLRDIGLNRTEIARMATEPYSRRKDRTRGT